MSDTAPVNDARAIALPYSRTPSLLIDTGMVLNRDSTDPSRVGTAMHELLGAGRLATEIGAPRRSSGAAGAGRGAPAGSGAGAGGRGGGRASGSRPGGVSRNSLESLSRLHAQQMVR